MPQEATKRAIEAEPAEVPLQERVAVLAYQLWQQRGCNAYFHRLAI